MQHIWAITSKIKGWEVIILPCLIGERQTPQSALFKEFNAPPPPSPPTHLAYNDHLIADFLSFHMSLVVVMNCGAGNALRDFEISIL